jgi:hypothetical protein
LGDKIEARWQEFEELGEAEVRKRIGSGIFGPQKARLANQWIESRGSAESSEARRHALAVANEANSLARSANEAAVEANSIARKAADSASLSAEAARNNNRIATAALIAATIAIALSIIGLFLKK